MGTNKNYIYSTDFTDNTHSVLVAGTTIYTNTIEKKVQLRTQVWGNIGYNYKDIPEVNSDCNGLMSIADKQKLDNTPTFWTGTQTEYDSIQDKDENTYYFIKEG